MYTSVPSTTGIFTSARLNTALVNTVNSARVGIGLGVGLLLLLLLLLCSDDGDDDVDDDDDDDDERGRPRPTSTALATRVTTWSVYAHISGCKSMNERNGGSPMTAGVTGSSTMRWSIVISGLTTCSCGSALTGEGGHWRYELEVYESSKYGTETMMEILRVNKISLGGRCRKERGGCCNRAKYQLD